MESLPVGPLCEILSYLNLNEQARCRLVSQGFKWSVEDHLSTVTHIQVLYKHDESDYVDHATEEEFLFKRFFTATPCWTEIEYKMQPVDSFFSFISKWCPNLQVLYTNEYCFTFDHLFPLTKLRYFRCKNIEVGTVVDDAQTLFSQLKHLQAFSAGPFKKTSHYQILLAKQLYKNKQLIHKLVNPSTKLLDKETFESFAVQGIKSLEYCVPPPEEGQLYPITETVARHLSELSLYSVPCDDFILSPLPSLKYLYINQCTFERFATRQNLYFSSPHLKSIFLRCKLTLKLIKSIFDHFHSLKELESVKMRISMIYAEDETITVALPPNINYIQLTCNEPLELSHCYSDRLTYLDIDCFHEQYFNLPNLKVLKIECRKMDSSTSALANSISISHKLEHVSLIFDFHYIGLDHLPPTSLYQYFVDTFSSLRYLEDLTFEVLPRNAKNVSTGGPVLIKHENFCSLTSLDLHLPCEIVFQPKNSFKSMRLLYEIEFSNFNSKFSFSGNSVKIQFTEHMDRLRELSISEGNHSWIIAQVEYLKQIQHIDFKTKRFGIEGFHNDKYLLLPNPFLYEVLFCSSALKCFKYAGCINWNLLLRLFDHFNTLTELKEVDLCVKLLEQNCPLVNFSLLPHIERLYLSLDVPIEFSFYVPDSLQLDDFEGIAFIPSKLHGFKLITIPDALTNPLPLDLPQKLEICQVLKSFSMRFQPKSSPSITYIQNMIQILASLVDLQTIRLLTYEGNLQRIEGSVVIRHSDFPSLKKFIWGIPFNVTFYCLDVFDYLFCCSDIVLSSDEIHFQFYGNNDLTIPNASSLTRLTFAEIIDASSRPFPSPPISGEFLNQLTNLEHLFLKSNIDDQLASTMASWIASLSSLKIFTAISLSQERLISLLTNCSSTRIEVVVQGSDTTVMNDELHRLVNELKAKDVIADFHSPWTCQCESNACWLKKKIAKCCCH